MKRIIISALCVILLGAAFLTLGPTDSNSSGTARKASAKAKPAKKKARANHSYARFANKEYAIKYLRKKGIAMNDMEGELIRQMQDGQLETAAALVGAGASLNKGLISKYRQTILDSCSLVNMKTGLDFNGLWSHYLLPTSGRSVSKKQGFFRCQARP